MPSLEITFFHKINTDNIFNNYPIFIETGTYLGETILSLEDKFKELYTIEIKKEYYDNIRKEYKGNKINFILGDSSIVLNNLCNFLENNCIFFLDGHWSAGNTGKGDKDCPLYEELSAINNNFKHNAIIIIDDVRLFGKGPNIGNEVCNWEDINISNILKIVENRLVDSYFLDSVLDKNDRFILHIKNI
jgi:hypothetical protein